MNRAACDYLVHAQRGKPRVLSLFKPSHMQRFGGWGQVDEVVKQYLEVLAADGALPLLESLQADARSDIQQIEKQLTAIYIDAKAARISAALDECVTPPSETSLHSPKVAARVYSHTCPRLILQLPPAPALCEFCVEMANPQSR